MKLTGNLKKQVEATATKDEAREAIRRAGMVLDDAELDTVMGGIDSTAGQPGGQNEEKRCSKCGQTSALLINGLCPECQSKTIDVKTLGGYDFGKGPFR